jgi:hypothetical protein
MKTLLLLSSALFVAVVPTAGFTQAAGPAPGQSSANQASDEVECSALATQQTGFDPARPAPPPATASPQVAGSGSRARGAAAGAMIGGASGGDAGAGAAAGAVAGGVAQRSRSRRSARAQNDAMAQNQQAGQAAYAQARAACLSSRGAVK